MINITKRVRSKVSIEKQRRTYKFRYGSNTPGGFTKGHTLGLITRFKPGHKPWNTGKHPECYQKQIGKGFMTHDEQGRFNKVYA